MVKITNVSSVFQADQMVALLKDNGIIAIKKTIGAGGYMIIMGQSSVAGFDILVDEKQVEQAKKIVSQLTEPIEGTESEEDGEELDGYQMRIKWKLQIIRIWAVFMICFFLFMLILKIYNLFR